MSVSRRVFAAWIGKTTAAAALVATVGCSGNGPLSGEPKKYEGGGPIPEFTGEEVKDEPSTKPKGH